MLDMNLYERNLVGANSGSRLTFPAASLTLDREPGLAPKARLFQMEEMNP